MKPRKSPANKTCEGFPTNGTVATHLWCPFRVNAISTSWGKNFLRKVTNTEVDWLKFRKPMNQDMKTPYPMKIQSLAMIRLAPSGVDDHRLTLLLPSPPPLFLIRRPYLVYDRHLQPSSSPHLFLRSRLYLVCGRHLQHSSSPYASEAPRALHTHLAFALEHFVAPNFLCIAVDN